MHSERYFLSFRRALFGYGIMGQPAGRLMAELQDHLTQKQLSLQQAGEDASETEKKACAALGEPHVVAARAAETLRQGNWMARHPVWFGLAFGLTALLINFLTVVTVGSLCTKVFVSCNYELKWVVANLALIAMNWLPVILGFVALGWLARSRVMGWGSLLAGAGCLIFFTSILGIWTMYHSANPEWQNQVCLTFVPVNDGYNYYHGDYLLSYMSRLLICLLVLPAIRYLPLRLPFFSNEASEEYPVT